MPTIKLTPEAVTLYEKGWTQKRIAEHFNCARNTVSQYLSRRKSGEPTRFAPMTKLCSFCDVPIAITGARRDVVNHYCSQKCYYNAIRTLPYIRCVASTIRARDAVSNIYGVLPAGSVVHHRDNNNTNNAIRNLVLFANQRDHFRFHRRCSYSAPLWLGAPELPLETFPS